MDILRGFGIGRRLQLGFGGLALVGLSGVVLMAGLDRGTGLEARGWGPRIEALLGMEQVLLMSELQRLEAEPADSDTGDIATQPGLAVHGQLEFWQRRFESWPSAAGIRNEYRALLQDLQTYLQTDGVTPLEPLLGRLQQLIQWHRQAEQVERAGLQDAAGTQRLYLVLGIVGVLTAALLWGLLIIRSVTRPLQQAVQVAERISGGDLQQRILPEGGDEISRLMRSVQGLQHHLLGTLHSVNDATARLLRTGEQMSAVAPPGQPGCDTEPVVAVEAPRTPESAQDLSSAVRQLSHLAETLMVGVEQVSHKACNVQDISRLLDIRRGMAEQTNLLALNVAIETAHGGDAGSGVAVLADEVGHLARRAGEVRAEVEPVLGRIRADGDIPEAEAAWQSIRAAVEQIAAQAQWLAGGRTASINPDVVAATAGSAGGEQVGAELAALASRLRALVVQFRL